LQAVAARILETRALDNDPSALSRELFLGFHEVCQRYGLDGLLADLDLSSDADAAEHPELRAAVAAKLANKADFDPRGPRNAKPAQLAQCLLGGLGVTVVDAPDRAVQVGEGVRTEITAALTKVIEPALAVPKIREDIVSRARARIDEDHLSAFEKIVAQLDSRGMRLEKTPKVPLDTLQTVQQLLFEARNTVLDKAIGPAIDRAKEILARDHAEAAARIDQPISRELTPRQVAIRRIADVRASKAPSNVVSSIVETLTELVPIAWQVQEQASRPYSASQSFAVGELIDHPKLGRGTVVSLGIGKMDVEFEHGKSTLVQPKK
jgi:hypothetical protein